MLKRINHPLNWGVLMMLAGAGGLVALGALAGAGSPAYLALGAALVLLPFLTWTARARWRGAEDRALGRIVVLALAVYGLVMAVMALVVGQILYAPFAGLYVGGAVMLLGLHYVALTAPRAA